MKNKLTEFFSPKNQQIEFEPQEIKDWELIRRSYAPPVKRVGDISNLPEDVQAKALLGVTVYVWREKTTGEMKIQELLGSDMPILEELFIKVNQYGPQHIKDEDGNVYTLSKYSAPVQNPMDLPLRRVGE